MSRDYAPRGEPRKAVRRRKDGAMLPGWVWLFAGLSIGMAAAAFYYIGRPVNSKAPPAEPEETQASKSAAANKKKEPLQLPPKEKPRFTFYEILPNQEVVIPRESLGVKAPGAARATAPVKGEMYFIQVASYRDKGEAEKQRASLALIGAEARIEKVTIDNKDTYYRVRIGPDKSLTHAQDLMARLEENGIQAMLVKVKN